MFILLKHADKLFGLIGISVLSALAHNIGQLFAAIFITGTASIAYYAPALALFGIATGAVTGIILRAVMPALDKIKKHFFNINT